MNTLTDLDLFLNICREVSDTDSSVIESVALTTIKYLQASKEKRKALRLNQELEQAWYHALKNGGPDWSIYDADLYLAELWSCWMVYSRKYLISIRHPKSLIDKSVVDDLGAVGGIADLGCGIGYTSALLRKMYPVSYIVGTNFDGMKQTRVAQKLGGMFDFCVVPDVRAIDHPVDLVFASEYFEHIPNPIDHLVEVVNTLHPRALLIANTFTARAVGHFDQYVVSGSMLNGRETSLAFNHQLRDFGYEKSKTKLWNNRPTYWKMAA